VRPQRSSEHAVECAVRQHPCQAGDQCGVAAAIVASVVGERDAQRYAAILLTGAHGAAGLGCSGLLQTDKWHTTPDELIDAFIATVTESARLL
jgi:hypothetical protein